jgi:hypothetical protein
MRNNLSYVTNYHTACPPAADVVFRDFEVFGAKNIPNNHIL